jgi:hypothetical protein
MWKTDAITACGRALTMEACHRLCGRRFQFNVYVVIAPDGLFVLI